MVLNRSKRLIHNLKSLSLCHRRRSPGFLAPAHALPPELVEAVTSLLQPTDLCALRMTCKSLYEVTYSVFWKTSLQSVKSDLSLASPQKLETISRDTQLRHYVKHMAFRGFDENNDILGEGYQWNHHRHPSGHLINLQEHPAVQELHNILCRFINCKSFEVYAGYTKPRHHSDDANFRPTDSITTLLNVITRAILPVTALTVNFMGYG